MSKALDVAGWRKIGATGFEPVDPPTQVTGAQNSCKTINTQWTEKWTESESALALVRIVQLWPRLSPPLQQAILSIIASVDSGMEGK
ncbi:MAG: hypothetical protein B9S32_08855 [Verrucomicrobia bacterium Tous-C9LFEB]|nr:MAG: hypothetical protein B9S32_08855 [Verrucomicrobia bacterium Tous-C9LFEB]